MRVLMTGSTGFIGSILTQKLEERGYEVYRFMRHFHPRYDPNSPRIIYGDITDPAACKLAVERSMPDIIIHLAAIATTDQYMYDHPVEFSHVIYDGTVNMAEAFRQASESRCRQFIYASSSEVYGHQEEKDRPFTEELEPHPCNVYAVAKYAGEMYLKRQFASYGIPYTIMRNFNTYGNLQYQRTFIDRCVKEMLQGKPAVQLGNPDAIRDWEYIDDHVSSYLTVLNNQKAFNEVFNFCRGEPFTCRETADAIRAVTDYKGKILWKTGHPRPNDVLVLHGDPSKAKRVLGWKAEYGLMSGLEAYSKQLATKSD